MSEKVHKEIESWIRANISVEMIGAGLLEGLKADKISNKEVVPDFGSRLAYIDWVCVNGRYIAEKKVAGGTFSMTPPTQEDVSKTFSEPRPADD